MPIYFNVMVGRRRFVRSVRLRLRLAVILLVACSVTLPTDAVAHRSGCHRWHSCPSDTGSYVCGDLGKCSGCPDNEYCSAGQPRLTGTEAPTKTQRREQSELSSEKRL